MSTNFFPPVPPRWHYSACVHVARQKRSAFIIPMTSICARCGGYVCLDDEERGPYCLCCGRAVNPIVPLPIVNGAGNLGLGLGPNQGKSRRDKLVGYKATGKGPGSLAR